jgi:DNA-binding response OmpR family regulator
MPLVLICTAVPLKDELAETLVGRDDVERKIATTAQEAATAAVTSRANLVIIDGEFPDGEALIRGLRGNLATRSVSIVIMARGDFDPTELHLMEAGANSILRLPAGPDWNDRLSTLMAVPPRRSSRLAVTLQFEAQSGDSVSTLGGTVLNLSERGMLIETDIQLEIGTDIDFKIHMGDGKPLLGCGQIVRHDVGRRCGVQFYGLEGNGDERIRKFVQTIKP